jgi:hypothetical protein
MYRRRLNNFGMERDQRCGARMLPLTNTPYTPSRSQQTMHLTPETDTMALTIPNVTKLQASRSWQNHATLQHEQWSSGELNILRDFSLQPVVTFSFVIGPMRYFHY